MLHRSDRCRLFTRSCYRRLNEPSSQPRMRRPGSAKGSTLLSKPVVENMKIVSGPTGEQGIGATVYTVAGAFFGGAAGGAWLGLVLMSLTGLYGNILLWKDLLAGILAAGAVAALTILCSSASGRLAGLRVILVAAVAVLNVAAALYFFGNWVCEVSPAGPAFTECRMPTPLGGLSLPRAILLLSPSVLAAVLGASVTVRRLLKARNAK